MKKIKALLSVFAVVFAAVNFTSCDTEPVDPVLLDNIGQQPGTPGPAVFKADFSGNTFVATSSAAVISNANVAITGLKGTNGEAFSVLINGTAVGSYSADKVILDYNPGTSEYSYSNVDLTTGQESGSVSITSIDTVNKTISGTFSFVGWWTDATLNLPSIAFTNGVFTNVPYTGNAGGGPVTGTEEFFKARVDGQDNTYEDADLGVAVGGGSGGVEVITINAFAPDHELIVSAHSDITPGTYQFGNGSASVASATFVSAADESFPVTGGALTITSNVNGFLKGTFSFTVTNTEGETHTVTNGDFNIEYDF
ncbi:hypothetical protein AMR72_16540 [Flavobacterium psychrophilum]|nr:hypothetical protein AMR72_16540 [Flavobacterium psychrophilum]AOE53966.1 hypothetical protein ALW18_16530 [Flavobacterium psychrophilum]